MKHRTLPVNWCLGCQCVLAVVTCGAPMPGSGPYCVISERNVFGLKPPPPVVKQQTAVPLPKLRLTGITTIFGDKRILVEEECPPQPGALAKKKSLTLVQGQKNGQLEVLDVDVKNARAKVDNSGTIQVITFEPLASGPGSAQNPTVSVRSAPAPRWWGGFGRRGN